MKIKKYTGSLVQCLNSRCPMKDTCFRYTMIPEDMWTHPSNTFYPASKDNQRYYLGGGEVVRVNTGECPHFVSNEEPV